MRKTIFFIVVLATTVSLHAQNTVRAYWEYIARWRDAVVFQQQEYGIPASITMAQALLESGAGKSELATEANNHFGIKCGGSWMGDSFYHDDDKEGECFRVYPEAEESFRDHSLFLQRPRYKSLYELPVSDYQGWAVRIRECGYATDPKYPQKLIKLIEDYGLDSLQSPTWTLPTDEQIRVANEARKQQQKQQTETQPSDSTATGTTDFKLITTDPEPGMEEPLSANRERKKFFQTHTIERARGVRYITAKEGDTYANIAFRLNIRERDLRTWNDALGLGLKKGERVYLASKHLYGEKKKAILWVHPGESLRMIAQREVMKLDNIYKLNELKRNVTVFRTRQRIYIRKVKEEKKQ
ncbi:MAG: glucosaminidase domain-containing protein [Paludibacteraceae bacterium]|nr:glucosaminidase domain-containing protein [Paludibacteraceae bacterium]MBQ2608542.1 glucosaminidase domain-containing protein [Paludibacteraceae bacterium]